MVKELTIPVFLGYEWLLTYNPQVNCISYTVQISSSTSSEVCLAGVRPHCLKPVVELCSARAALHELHKGAVAWFLQLQVHPAPNSWMGN